MATPRGTVFRTLGERLWARIARGEAKDCWPWTGGKSKSGRRKVYYGALQQGGRGSRMWRAHRLVLILATGPEEVPPADGEEFLAWLDRARKFYQDVETAHQCDNSLCCNPGHLAWETHGDNLTNQRARQQAIAAAEEMVA